MNKIPYHAARICLAVLFSTLGVSAARAATIEVAADGNFQEALNAASPGDTIVLQAGATYTGNFRLPNKVGASFITIRSSAADRLPGSQRVRPADAVHMARIVSPNANAAIEADAGAHHYRLIGLELTVQPGNYTFGVLGLGSGEARSVDVLPDNIEVDRLYIHGTPGEGGKRGIFLNTHTAVVRNSYISGFRSDFQDAQAILACAAPGPLLITNNYLEATGENVMLGGCDTNIPRMVPTDVTFTRNHLFKPLSWQGQRLVVKNSFEIKGGRRIRIDSNIFENNWIASQSGFMILFTVRVNAFDENNQPFGLVEDITFTNNLLLNSTHGISIMARDDSRNDKAGIAQRIVVRNNVFEKVPGRLIQLLEGPPQVVIDHNTSTAGDMTLLVTHSAPGFEMTNNVLSLGTYGLFGNGVGSGMPAVRAYLPGSKIEGNVFIGPQGDYPANNLFAATLSSVGFTDATAGNYRLTTASPYRGKARDGQDPGINAEVFSASQRGVLNGTVRALLNSNAIVNTASFEQKLSPGARVSIFGENLSDCLTAAYPPVRSLCQTEVLINSNAALLYYVSSTQIVAQLPTGLTPDEAFEVMVRRAGENSSDLLTVPAAAVKVVSPAMYFYRTGGDAANRVMMMQADGTFNGPGVGGLGPGTLRPVRLGEEVTVFVNGAGPTDPFLEEGAVAPWDPPAAFANRVSVFINDVEQQVTFAGAIPELVGLYSVRFQLNRETPAIQGEDRIWINVVDTESPRLLLSLANTGN